MLGAWRARSWRAACRPRWTVRSSLRPLSTQPTPPPAPLPSAVDVVVVGGGAVGCASAYHLALRGKRVLLVEQHKLTSGTTWHAAGLIGTTRSTLAETRLSMVGSELYEQLEDRTGLSTGFRRCGSLTLATSPARLVALQRIAARTHSFGLPAQVLAPDECERKWSGKNGERLLNMQGVVGGLWLERDGSANASDVCMALAKGARLNGADIREGVRVTGFEIHETHAHATVTAVHTTHGTVSAPAVLLCTGQWSRQLGALAHTHVPVHPCEHYYVVTQPIPGVHADLPILRDPDGLVYMREWGASALCVGGFERRAKPVFTEKVPEDFAFSLLPDDWEQFSELMEAAMARVPALETVQVNTMVNGPESFTQDGKYVMGPSPAVRGLFVCCGMNSSGIAASAGAGKAMGEWIANGSPSHDVWDLDIARLPLHVSGSPGFLRERVTETLGLHYQIPWPTRFCTTSRNARLTALHAELDAAGAVWGEESGWERAEFFSRDAAPPKLPWEAWTRPPWVDSSVLPECEELARGVGLYDASRLSKCLVQGKGAQAVLERVCAARVGADPHKIVLSPMLNSQGGYVAEVGVVCQGVGRYLVTSPSSLAVRVPQWIRANMSDEEANSCAVVDVTSSTSVLVLMGDKCAHVLEASGYLGRGAFTGSGQVPWGTVLSVDVGPVVVTAIRLCYAARAGYELHIPVESTLPVYRHLQNAAASLGLSIRPVGHSAMEAMRIERGVRLWGKELTASTTPLEAGTTWMLGDAPKGEFIGASALAAQQESGGPQSTLLCLRASELGVDADGRKPHVWGGEAIVSLDRGASGPAAVVGRVTSAAASPSFGGVACMGYVPTDVVARGGALGVDVGGRVLPVEIVPPSPKK